MKSNKQKLKQGYMKFIYDNHPRYFLTITFTANTHPSKARAMQNLFIKGLNQKIYRRRKFNNKTDFMNGLSVCEHTHKLYTDHFHLVIFNDSFLPDEERFHEIIHKQQKRINRQFGKDKITTYDLQLCYETGGYALEKYVLKQFDWWKHEQQCINDVGNLDFDNVLFGYS